jgi:dCTP deaminase
MILSNVELHRALDSGRLVIDPEPKPRFLAEGEYCPFDTHSVDLRLGDDIVIPEKGSFAWNLTDTEHLAATIARNSRKLKISRDQPFPLNPQQFILATTLERVELPMDHDPCLAARIEGKSSRARCGVLVHFTAPTVHPGWMGRLTLEMINLGPAPFVLVPGMSIAQLIVEEVRGRPVENPSDYQNQIAPEGNP